MLTKQQITTVLSQLNGLRKLVELWAANSPEPLESLINNIIFINGINKKTLEEETFLRFPTKQVAVEHWMSVSSEKDDLVIIPSSKPMMLCEAICLYPKVLYAAKAEAISRLVGGCWNGMAIDLRVFINNDPPAVLRRKALRVCQNHGIEYPTLVDPFTPTPIHRTVISNRIISAILN